MIRRLAVLSIVGAIAALVAAAIPDITRYLKIREM
jgi:hypothetical protein